MKKILLKSGVIFCIIGLTSCAFKSNISTSGTFNSKSYIEETAKKDLFFFKNEDFQINYAYCYYKSTQAKEKGKHLIVDECKEAYDTAKRMCLIKKNMEYCASLRNLASEIYNNEKMFKRAKQYLKYYNPNQIDFHLSFIGNEVIIDYKKFYSDNEELQKVKEEIRSNQDEIYSIKEESESYHDDYKLNYTHKTISQKNNKEVKTRPLTDDERKQELDYIKKVFGF